MKAAVVLPVFEAQVGLAGGAPAGYNARIMLKHFRNKKTQKKIYIFLALVIIPSFIITGAVLFTPDERRLPTMIGKIDGKDVSLQQYLAGYRAVYNQMAMVYGDRLPEAQRALNFRGEAWDRLLLLDYARKKRIKTGDGEVG